MSSKNYRLRAGVYGLVELAAFTITTSILLVTSFTQTFSLVKFVFGILGFCLAGFPTALLVGLLHRNKYMLWIYLIFNGSVMLLVCGLFVLNNMLAWIYPQAYITFYAEVYAESKDGNYFQFSGRLNLIMGVLLLMLLLVRRLVLSAVVEIGR